LDLVAAKFREIIDRDGPDAIAGVSSARSINEDSYQMQKLFRAVIGTNNIDHCART
jgi:predicted molibdopterin-dependent oxidoreductase YjgC